MVILVLFSRCWSFRTFERCSRSKIMKIMKCALFIFYAFSLVFQFFIAYKSYHSILLPTFSARKVDWDKGKKIEFSRKNNKNAWLQVNDRFFGYGDFSVFMHFFSSLDILAAKQILSWKLPRKVDWNTRKLRFLMRYCQDI